MNQISRSPHNCEVRYEEEEKNVGIYEIPAKNSVTESH